MTNSTADSGGSALAFDAVERIVQECVGEQMIRQVRASMVLPNVSPDFEHVPSRVLIVLFTARTGSTYAARLLVGTGYFNQLRGIFFPQTLGRFRERHGLSDDAAAARELVARHATPHAFGVKCGGLGLVGALYTGFLHTALAQISFIKLERRDLVAQAVSQIRAQSSGRYFSHQPARAAIEADDYDREAIEKQIELVTKLNPRLDRFAQLLGKLSPTFFYEDICDDPLGFVNAVLGLLGLQKVGNLDTDTGLDILRDDISRDWRERFKSGR